MKLRQACALALLVAGATACTVTATAPRVVVHTPPIAEVVVARPPPPLRVEEVPPPPPHGERFVWHRGHWQWEHGDYVWVGGHYEKRPAQAAEWIQPEWVARNGQWLYQPGHWVYR